MEDGAPQAGAGQASAAGATGRTASRKKVEAAPSAAEVAPAASTSPATSTAAGARRTADADLKLEPAASSSAELSATPAPAPAAPQPQHAEAPITLDGAEFSAAPDSTPVAPPEVGADALPALPGAFAAVTAPDSATAAQAEASIAAVASEAHAEPGTAPANQASAPRPVPEQRAAEILRQVRVQLTPELKSAVIQLAPAELGRISIELRVDDDDELWTRVRAERPEALEALRAHLPELRASLARQGHDVQHFDLALGFQDSRQGQEAQQGGPTRRPRSALPETEARELLPLRRLLAADAIDTYA